MRSYVGPFTPAPLFCAPFRPPALGFSLRARVFARPLFFPVRGGRSLVDITCCRTAAPWRLPLRCRPAPAATSFFTFPFAAGVFPPPSLFSGGWVYVLRPAPSSFLLLHAPSAVFCAPPFTPPLAWLFLLSFRLSPPPLFSGGFSSLVRRAFVAAGCRAGFPLPLSWLPLFCPVSHSDPAPWFSHLFPESLTAGAFSPFFQFSRFLAW